MSSRRSDRLFDRRLVVKGESAFDVAQLLRHFSDIDLDILEALLGLRGGVASFLGVGHDVVDGGAGLVGPAIAVELVSIAELMLCDADAEIGAVFGPRAFDPCFEFVDGFVLGRAVGRRKGKNGTITEAHKRQRGAWRSTLLRFNSDQAMGSLPLLIGILPVGNIQKVMIIDGGVFVVAQVVIRGSPKKKTEWRHLRI
jgi:hypothetical protein